MSGRVRTLHLAGLMFLSLCFLGLAGCESIQEIDRAAGEWAKKHNAERVAREAARREQGVLTGKQRSCRRMDQSLNLSGIDPDTAYVRIKRFFGFKTWEEARKTYSYPEMLPYTSFRHEALPGVRYSMSQDITWPSAVYGPAKVWLTVDIERAPHGSVIRWSWCQGSNDGWAHLGDPAQVKRHLAKDIGRVARGG